MTTKKSLLFISVVLFSLYNCSKDEDYFSLREDIKGIWKLDGIYKYDLEGNIIDTRKYNLIWNIGQDSIQSTQIFGFENIGTGILKQQFEYKIYPNKIFLFGKTKSKIISINHDEFVFSLRRPDHTTTFIFYSVSEDDIRK